MSDFNDQDIATIMAAFRAVPDILEAVRALKPAPQEELRWSAAKTLYPNTVRHVEQLEAEVERLQKLMADQALTIGALKDELGSWKRLAEEREEAHTQGYRECADLKKFEIEGLLVENSKLKAEAKRFREREKDVQRVLNLADDDARYGGRQNASPLLQAIAAVRDFKVSEHKPATNAELRLRKYGPIVQAQWEWHEQRDHYVKMVKAFYGANIDETDVLEAVDKLIEWEKANPKPQAVLDPPTEGL